MIKAIFWILFFTVFYTYIGYGVLVYVLSKFCAKSVKRDYSDSPVTVLITAHNEEKNIKSKIDNIFLQDYPLASLKVLVVSDGSTDRTVDIVNEIDSPNLQLVEIDEKVGKAEALNRAIPLCDTDLVLLADSRQSFKNDTVKEIVANFGDENVGAVSGELCFRESNKTVVSEGLDFYWKYEKFLRKHESAIDSSVGATGAIYAIRKKSFRPIAPDTLLDDVVIPMNTVLQGYRCVFEPNAIAYDDVAKTSEEESWRKIRTIAGNFQMFFSNKELRNPFRNRIWVQYFSHKFLRTIAPALLVALLVFNGILAGDIFYRILFFMQIGFYLLGITGCILRNNRLRLKVFSVPQAFVMLNYFTLKAFCKYLFFDPQYLWRKDKI